MTAFLCCVIAAAAHPPMDVNAFLAEFSKHRNSIHTLQATFTQVNVTPEEKRKITGTITYMRPRRILFHYDRPRVSYLVDGQKVYQYDVKAKQIQMIDLENDPQTEAFFLGFDDNTERLKQAYSLSLFTPQTNACGDAGLQLIPKPTKGVGLKRNDEYFEKVRICLDKDRYLPCQIEIVNDKNSKVLISVSNIKINAPNAPQNLTISVPEGTSIVQGDEMLPPAGPGGATFPRPAPVPAIPPVTSQDLNAP